MKLYMLCIALVLFTRCHSEPDCSVECDLETELCAWGGSAASGYNFECIPLDHCTDETSDAERCDCLMQGAGYTPPDYSYSCNFGTSEAIHACTSC